MNGPNLLLLATAALLQIGASSPPSAETSPARIPSSAGVSGMVFDAVSGTPVEGAEVVLLETRLGTRTTRAGAFQVVSLPGSGWEGEIEVRHPCFHTVRVELGREHAEDPLVVGLPFRIPRNPDGSLTPVFCGQYGPAGPP
jgi:hypothetical protein